MTKQLHKAIMHAIGPVIERTIAEHSGVKLKKAPKPEPLTVQQLLDAKTGHMRFLGYFMQKWEAKMGEQYVITSAKKEYSQAARIYKAVDNKKSLVLRVDAYFRRTDADTVANRFTLGWFSVVLNQCVPEVDSDWEE